MSSAVAPAQSSTPQQQPTPPTSGSANLQPASSAAAAAAGRSYASAANRKSVVGFGGSIHTKSESLSAANGRSAISPAVPTIGGNGPTTINGNASVSQAAKAHDHARKPSVTISAAGTTGQMPNGGPVAGQTPIGSAIQFGSVNNGPKSPSDPNMAQQDTASLAVNAPTNPRITSPSNSPSPIPQPAVPSGGRPPSSLHGQTNSLSFGAFGGDDSQRRSSIPGGQMTPNMQNAHLRRDSVHSQHTDMNIGPGAGRGGFSQGGRGRGGFNANYNGHMQGSPARGYATLPPNAPRGPGPNMPPQFATQRGPSYNGAYGSPHQAGRSPAVAHVQPMQQQQQQTQMAPMQSPGMPPGGYYGPQSGPQNMQGYYDPQGYYNQPYMQGQMPGMYNIPPQNGYMPGPNSPRPHYQSQNSGFIPNQYGHPPSMSRQNSSVSTERPASTLSQPPQTPMTTSSNHQHTASRGTASPGPKSQFQIPTKKASAAVKITNPTTGEALKFDKAPASPAPSVTSKAPESAPTPPPRTPSSQHNRTESKAHKTSEEVKNELREQVQAKVKADQEAAQKSKDEEEAKKQHEQEAVERAAREKVEAEEAAKKAEEDKRKAQAELAAKEAEEARLSQERAIEAEKAKAAQLEAAAKRVEEDNARIAAAVASEKSAEPAPAKNENKLQAPEMPDVNASDAEWEKYEAEVAAYEEAQEAAYAKKKAAKKVEEAAKEAEKNANLDAELKRQEAEAERLEAEKEKKRATGGTDSDTEAFAELKKSTNAFKATETATENPPDHGAETSTSGADTPKSDAAAMPPPSRLGQKPKPAALKLETQKPVEAAQPSAALQSLRSAKKLTHFDPGLYPSGIMSPNPALNTAAKGSVKYDKDFLLQFQKVFTEKPSETWAEKLRETVGDTSETPRTARGPSTMGPRTGSARGTGANAFAGGMGQFASGPRTLPPGTTSTERFAAATGRGGPAPPVAPLRYDSKSGFGAGGFPMPVRQPSSQLGARAPSGRGGSTRGPSNTGGKRAGDKDAKTMPLTAGMDLKPIEISDKGWKPMSITRSNAGPPPGGEAGYLAPDIVQRKVKSALNKMTPTTFEKISGQILDIVMQSKQESDGRTLRQVIQLTFEKATDEAHWAEMYAQFCGKMLGAMTAEIRDETIPKDKNGNVVSGSTLFRKYLLNRCQQDFEQGWKSKLPEKPEDAPSGEAAMLSEEYYIAAAAKRRGLGLVRFIGELYKLGMLTARIMHMCVQRLVDFEGMPDEAEVESLTSLLRTIGAPLDADEKSRAMMNAYFDRIDQMIKTEGLPSRLRFMLMDIVDLRKHNWVGKNAQNKGPATIDQVRAEAEKAQREAAARSAADQQSRRGGGGSRPGVGRGDARNFSGPPPDFNGNRVGVDDLRRLGTSRSSRGTGSQGPMGPQSMFTARGSNKRSSLAPGGIFANRGDDSGASSRTGTPPAKADKPAAASNAFSALAGLDAESNDTPAASPPMQKRPLPERTHSKSPGGRDSGANAGA